MCTKRMVITALRIFALSMAVGVQSAAINGQCEPEWHAFHPSVAGLPGATNVVNAAIQWDPDGSGPAKPRLVVGGQFGVIGDALASGIAFQEVDSANWKPLGKGVAYSSGNVAIWDLAAQQNGDLVVGGTFDYAGGVPASNVARWDTLAGEWKAMGDGLLGPVGTLNTRPNGDVIAAYVFNAMSPGYLRRWNGATWASFAIVSGPSPIPYVNAMVTMQDGDLVAGGDFTGLNGKALSNIGRWDEVTKQWSALGSGVTGAVGDLEVLADGSLIAAGSLSAAGGNVVHRIARWDGAQWSPLAGDVGGAVGDAIYAVAALPNGELLAGGVFSAPWGVQASNIARWTGQSWVALGEGTDAAVHAIASMPDGGAFVGGAFKKAGQWPALRAAVWHDSISGWSQIGTGLTSVGFGGDSVSVVLPLSGGNAIIGGQFNSIGGVLANHIATWDASTENWTPMGLGLGSGSPNFNAFVAAAIRLQSGEIAVGGSFVLAGGASAYGIARWDGAEWHGVGEGLRYGPAVGQCRALASTSDGRILVGGTFTQAGSVQSNSIAVVDPANWEWAGFGTGLEHNSLAATANAICQLPSGDIVASGVFNKAGGLSVKNIARWDGGAWFGLGSGLGTGFGDSRHALAVLPNGELVAGGVFQSAGGVATPNIAKWNGSAWSALGGGLGGPVAEAVRTLALMPDGGGMEWLVAGGSFYASGSTPLSRVARWNGQAWSPVGAVVPGASDGGAIGVLSLTLQGELIAGGSFLGLGGRVIPGIAQFGCSVHPCLADCDGSGSLDIDDFICFQTLYALSDPKADCDESGALDIDDFICFQTAYAIGC